MSDKPDDKSPFDFDEFKKKFFQEVTSAELLLLSDDELQNLFERHIKGESIDDLLRARPIELAKQEEISKEQLEYENAIDQLKFVLKQSGYTTADIKTLCMGQNMANFLHVLKGINKKPKKSQSSSSTHLIDCDANPFIPEGWTVEEHKRGGQFTFDPSNVNLFLSPNQQNGKTIVGRKLRQELANKPVLNANVLDYLLKNTHLIPEEWKGKYIFFWGTIYRNSYGYRDVRYLDWYDGRWYSGYYWLDCDWHSNCPSALYVVSA